MKLELGVSGQVQGEVAININDEVFVRLTSYGKEVIKDSLKELGLVEDIQKSSFEMYTKTDQDGWTKLQLHVLMDLFGSVMHPGGLKGPVFEENLIRIGSIKMGFREQTSEE